MTRFVISLTSVPPRFQVLHECLESLISQTAPIAEIGLFIPSFYRRFGKPLNLPVLPPEVTLRIFDDDLGPAMKVLPASKLYRGSDTKILFCDDDKIYDPNWAQRLIDASNKRPGECIVEQGTTVSRLSSHTWSTQKKPTPDFVTKNILYRLKRAASLGFWKPEKCRQSGYVDILEGWRGGLVKPEFFTDTDFQIPDILWTVDDVWLSGCLERKGIPIWLNHTGRCLEPKANSDEKKHIALRKFSYKGYNRAKANAACIDYFRDEHGIWGG